MNNQTNPKNMRNPELAPMVEEQPEKTVDQKVIPPLPEAKVEVEKSPKTVNELQETKYGLAD